MLYNIKTKYTRPVEGGESGECESVVKNYIVEGLSTLDANVRIQEWKPSNYTDFSVVNVSASTIAEVVTKFAGEKIFTIKIGIPNDKNKMKYHQIVLMADDFGGAIANIKKLVRAEPLTIFLY